MWSPDQSNEIKTIARAVMSELRCYAIPQGLRLEKGSEAVIEHVKSQLPDIIDGTLGQA